MLSPLTLPFIAILFIHSERTILRVGERALLETIRALQFVLIGLPLDSQLAGDIIWNRFGQ